MSNQRQTIKKSYSSPDLFPGELDTTSILLESDDDNVLQTNEETLSKTIRSRTSSTTATHEECPCSPVIMNVPFTYNGPLIMNPAIPYVHPNAPGRRGTNVDAQIFVPPAAPAQINRVHYINSWGNLVTPYHRAYHYYCTRNELPAWRQHLLGREAARAELNHPQTFLKSELNPDKYYAKWAGAYAEVNDDLIAKSVCPSNLVGVPCEFDEFDGGCSMVRLCDQLVKYTSYTCPDAPFRSPAVDESAVEPTNCPHIHWEVEINCRFVSSYDEKPDRRCAQVERKYRDCSVGHDFETARQTARHAEVTHKAAARLAGSGTGHGEGLMGYRWMR